MMNDGEKAAATAKSFNDNMPSEDKSRLAATNSHEESTGSSVSGTKRGFFSISRCSTRSIDENGSGNPTLSSSEPSTSFCEPKSPEKQRQSLLMSSTDHSNPTRDHTEAALHGVLSGDELLERRMRRASIVDGYVEEESTASNDQVLEQFGANTQLWCPTTGQHKSAAEVLRNKVVVLYFSAQWCPPCRRFTPLLKNIYTTLRQRTDMQDDFEFVYCSKDNFTTEYKGYASQMPWWSLPHQSPVIDRLKTIYKTDGIPHLCVIDKDGELLCGDAVNEAMEDTTGVRFPWRCVKAIEEILPETYIMGDDPTAYHSTADLDDKYLILYFGAGWCPRSTAFTKKVVRAYRALKRTRDDFEILYVSSDRDRRAFKEAHGQMPFGAIPFGDRYAKNKLAHFLGVKGIPALMIFGPRPARGGETNRRNRPLINRNIREVFERGDHMREFPYCPESFGDINRVTADINGHRFVIVFHEAGDDHDQDEIKEAMETASRMYCNDQSCDKPIKFCWAFCFSGLCESLRSVLRLGHPKDTPTMVLLDIPDNGCYYLCPGLVSETITADSILSFIQSPGPRIQI